LDLNLPKMSGREVLIEVRANERLAKLPVVVLTSSPTHRDILQSEGLHVESYLIKPVDREHFNNTVRSLRKYMLSDILLPQ
jgi:two-component system, chemotaxis family, response regulator Rcp1